MEDLKQALKSQRRSNRILIAALRLGALGRYAAEYRAGTASRTARGVAPQLGAGRMKVLLIALQLFMGNLAQNAAIMRLSCVFPC
ncbi:hypothetical protein [Microbulbifer halophilus]